MTLRARTRHLDADVDLLAVAGDDGVVFERGRVGLAGRGTAAVLAWPEGDPVTAARDAAAALAAVASDDAVGVPGTGPVAFGALPFAPGAGTTLVVPEVVVGRAEDGTRWITVVADDGPAGPAPLPDPDAPTAADLLGPRAGRREPQRYTVTSAHSPEWWCDLVGDATAAAAGGAFEKVVLSRLVEVATDHPLDRTAVLGRLRTAYPGCHVVGIGPFVAASPELLVAVSGDIVRSHPMAGTAPRGGDPAADQRLAASLLASPTYRHEHQVTIDVVRDALLGWCSYVDYEAEPSVVAVANVQHLATRVEGRLCQPRPSVLELVAALHPTPAVAGRPRDAALAWIAAHEGIDRGRYAGASGWVDAAGNGTWAVSVRCAEIEGTRARVWAGNGIVADSDPAHELAETRAKLQAVLSAVVRP
ncbi:MAG TPA: isochorismate synthase [Acidimicrobiales bacterium]|nr:isochorismate synthase [Acidimicrobiales bacterium]